MRALIFFVFAGLAFPGYAQEDFLVTRKSDTLRGKITIMSYDLVDRVQVNANKKRQTFAATELRAVHMDTAKLVPVQYNNSIRMMKVIRSGYLSYYAFKLPNQSGYEGRLLMKLGAPPQEVPNIGFKRIMADYLSDCGGLVSEIKSGDMSRREIEPMIDRYNDCVARPKVATQEQPVAVTVQPSDELTTMFDLLLQKIEASSLPSKKDALEMLNDMSGKSKRNETIPTYLIEGLKSAVADDAQLKDDVEKLAGLLTKKQ
jgi:hypothetical protein